MEPRILLLPWIKAGLQVPISNNKTRLKELGLLFLTYNLLQEKKLHNSNKKSNKTKAKNSLCSNQAKWLDPEYNPEASQVAHQISGLESSNHLLIRCNNLQECNHQWIK